MTSNWKEIFQTCSSLQGSVGLALSDFEDSREEILEAAALWGFRQVSPTAADTQQPVPEVYFVQVH